MAILLTAADSHLSSTSTNFPNRNAALTLSCWVNTTTWSNATQSIVGVYLPGTTGIQIGSQSTPGVSVWTWGGGLAVSTTGVYSPPVNEWIHIAYVWDGTYNMLYVEGILRATTTTTPVAGVLTSIYLNGYPTGGSAECSATSVDDVAFYNRALSSDEILTTSSIKGATDSLSYGLLARYRFNERTSGDTVISVIDISQNDNNLAVTGSGTAPTYVTGVADLDVRPVLG